MTAAHSRTAAAPLAGAARAVLVVLVAASWDCTCGLGGTPCTPGEANACLCPSGETGFQVCRHKGRRYDPCVCPDPDTGTADQVTGIDILVGPRNAVFAVDNMAPGDEITAPVSITNSGVHALRYAVTSVSSENKLAGQLQLTVREPADGRTCSTAGARIIAGPTAVATTAGHPIVGNAAPGQHAGDRIVPAGTMEILCLSVGLPLETTNAFQGLATQFSLNFLAEQIENNP